MIKSIPLSKLVASPRNVRRVVDEQADRQLMADVEARGLLQNLVVSSLAKPKGSFAVEAGGRRLKALQRLAEQDRLPKDHEVYCFVVEGGAAGQEASLAENFQRLSMNPADECLAFQQLVEQGCDIEGIARRFGLTARFVEGRLRLAGLAPVVFEALGSGAISLDVAKAYAASADQMRQAFVFEQMSRGYGAAHPDSIRRMMTQASTSAADRRALFVGEEAYVAAGGRIERDLFTPDSEARWLDIALLEQLAAEKLDAAAKKVAAEQNLTFVRPTLERWVGHAQLEGLRRVPLEAPALTDAETVRIDELEAEIEDLALLLEGESDEEAAPETTEAKIRQLSGEIDAIVNKPPVIDEELKGKVGTFILLDEQGRPRLDANVYADATQLADALDTGGGTDRPGEQTDDAPAEKPASFSQRLVDELAMQRRDVLAVHVAADPAFALDLAIFLMIDREAGYSTDGSGSSLCAMPPANPVFDFKTPDAAATIARTEQIEALDRSWTEGTSRAQRFDAFRTLGEEARAAWLGHAVARTLEASLLLPGERACSFHDHLGQLLAIDIARWWRPTGANFFDRVAKAVTLRALTEVGGPALAARYAKAKKAELAQSCERIFSGDFIADLEVKEAALAWMPEAMRFATPPGLAGSEASGDLDESSDPASGDEAEASPHSIEQAA